MLQDSWKMDLFWYFIFHHKKFVCCRKTCRYPVWNMKCFSFANRLKNKSKHMFGRKKEALVFHSQHCFWQLHIFRWKVWKSKMYFYLLNMKKKWRGMIEFSTYKDLNLNLFKDSWHSVSFRRIQTYRIKYLFKRWQEMWHLNIISVR